MLNGTQSRVWNLQLYWDKDNDGDVETSHILDPAGPDFIQIGTEGGFLPKPVRGAVGQPDGVRARMATFRHTKLTTTSTATAWSSAVPSAPTC